MPGLVHRTLHLANGCCAVWVGVLGWRPRQLPKGHSSKVAPGSSPFSGGVGICISIMGVSSLLGPPSLEQLSIRRHQLGHMIFLNLALVAALAIEGVAAANSPTLTVPKVIVGRFMPMDWGFVQRSPLAHVMGPVSKRAALACPTGFTACNSSSSCAPDG